MITIDHTMLAIFGFSPYYYFLVKIKPLYYLRGVGKKKT
jgi:hypothetical protein